MKAKAVYVILRTAEMLQVCTGKTMSKDDQKHTHVTTERVSLLGNENSENDKIMVRSNTCRQVTDVGCTGSRVHSTVMAWWACQENVSKLKVKRTVKDNAIASISNDNSEQISVWQSEDGPTIDLNEDHSDLMTVLERTLKLKEQFKETIYSWFCLKLSNVIIATYLLQMHVILM